MVKPDNIKEIQARVLVWTYEEDTRERGKTVTKKYLKVKVHEKGKITNLRYELKDGMIGQLLEQEDSAAAFGQLKAGLVESGTALCRLMMAPLAKVNRIRMRFDPALKEVLWLASLLEKPQGMSGAVVLEGILIDWKDGLPDDEQELTQNETQRYTAGLTSLESSLRRLYGFEGQALQEEVERIRNEHSVQGTTGLPTITLPSAEDEGEE